MAKTRKPTVDAKWLKLAASQLEQQAEESIEAWILLGQANRYSENKLKAHVLRTAAKIKSIGERREYLRMNGVEA